VLGKAVTIRTLACVIDRRHSGSFSPSRVGNPQSSSSNCRNYTSRHDHRLCLLFLGRLCRQSLVRDRKTNRNSCSLRELAPCKAAAASSPANRFSLGHTGPCSLLYSRRVRPGGCACSTHVPLGNQGGPTNLFWDLERTAGRNDSCHLEAHRSCRYHSDSRRMLSEEFQTMLSS